jgi:hypothetical protein
MKMAKKSTVRDIGAEILEGIREIKRGEVGRRVTLPDPSGIGETPNSATMSMSEGPELASP